MGEAVEYVELERCGHLPMDEDTSGPPLTPLWTPLRFQVMGEAAAYVELERCGHLPMDEDPERFLAAVLPFLANVLEGRKEQRKLLEPIR